MTLEEKIEYLNLLKERAVRKAKVGLLAFTAFTMPTFLPAAFHLKYYDYLNDFAHGKIKKLMVFMPPQHGKSEGSTRRLPPFIHGLNPDAKIAVISYSASKARKFNREMQRVIDTPEYHDIFPETTINGANGKTTSSTWVRTSEEFEIVNHRGSLKTVGVGGPLTGDPVDILIMDDLYKDAKTAWSPTIRGGVADWYDTVADTRLHNDSQQLIVFTRWHQDDLAGRLLKLQGEFHPVTNPDGWVIVVYQAIKIGEPTEYDPREEGEALWPERHNLNKLQKVREKNNHVFQSLYQQDPKPAEGLMYERGFREYEVIPYTVNNIAKNYTDTADTGKDYLCSINYVESDNGNYVTDILFTTKPMEYTEVKTAEMLAKEQIAYSNIESNNGGRSFGRNVETQTRVLGNNTTEFNLFFQGDNKEIRIFTKSNEVQNLTFFPTGWQNRWPEFHQHITTYMKTGSNEHDDGADTLTGMVEMRGQSAGESPEGMFF